MPLMIIITLGSVLFLLSFISKRRFGVLGLALCGGALLSQFFSGNAVDLIESNGVILVSPPLATVVSIVLMLVPAMLLIFSGPKYVSKKAALAASIGFAIFGLVLLMPAIRSAMILDLPTKQFTDLITLNSSTIIAVCVAGAILDAMLMHSPKFGKSKEH